MHNHFSITKNGQTVKAYNTLNNVFPIYAAGEKLCAYIYVTTAQGQTVFKPAVPADGNFDICRGVLYVLYETVLDANELVGQTIVSAGFAYAPRANAQVNACAFNLNKNADERLLISGALYLSAAGANTKFCSGDNALVRALLGVSAFPLEGYQLAAGTNYMPSVPLERGVEGILQAVACTPDFSANGISFLAALSQNVSETLLLLNGAPVARSRPDLPKTVAIEYNTASEKGAVNLSGEFITEAFSVRVNDSAIIDYTLTSLPDAAHLYRRLLFDLPPAARLSSDPSARFFAAEEGGRITLYNSAGGGLIPYYWINASGVNLCADGAAFCYLPGVLKLIKNGEKEFNVPTGTKTETVYNNGSYLAAAVSGQSVLLHRIDSGLNITTTVVDYAGAEPFLINLETAIGVAAEGKACRVFTPFGEDAQLAAWLDSNRTHILSNPDAVSFAAGRLVFNQSGGSCFYIDYPQTSVKTVAGKGKISGGFFFSPIEGQNKTAVFSLENTAAAMLQVDGAVKSAFFKDGILYVFLEDGGGATYTVCSKKSKLVSPSINAGDTISCYVSKQEPQAGTVRIELLNNG